MFAAACLELGEVTVAYCFRAEDRQNAEQVDDQREMLKQILCSKTVGFNDKRLLVAIVILLGCPSAGMAQSATAPIKTGDQKGLLARPPAHEEISSPKNIIDCKRSNDPIFVRFVGNELRKFRLNRKHSELIPVDDAEFSISSDSRSYVLINRTKTSPVFYMLSHPKTDFRRGTVFSAFCKENGRDKKHRIARLARKKISDKVWFHTEKAVETENGSAFAVLYTDRNVLVFHGVKNVGDPKQFPHIPEFKHSIRAISIGVLKKQTGFLPRGEILAVMTDNGVLHLKSLKDHSLDIVSIGGAAPEGLSDYELGIRHYVSDRPLLRMAGDVLYYVSSLQALAYDLRKKPVRLQRFGKGQKSEKTISWAMLRGPRAENLAFVSLIAKELESEGEKLRKQYALKVFGRGTRELIAPLGNIDGKDVSTVLNNHPLEITTARIFGRINSLTSVDSLTLLLVMNRQGESQDHSALSIVRLEMHWGGEATGWQIDFKKDWVSHKEGTKVILEQVEPLRPDSRGGIYYESKQVNFIETFDGQFVGLR
ncbi:MAG: hypothetical protein GKS00_24630 [Alphaproteobacteria bacterium]|nr:hypothetical protein [Alphaproteobacteria bacterium]